MLNLIEKTDLNDLKRLAALSKVIAFLNEKKQDYNSKGVIELFPSACTGMVLRPADDSGKYPLVHAYSNISAEWVNPMIDAGDNESKIREILQKKTDWIDEVFESFENNINAECFKKVITQFNETKFLWNVRPFVRHKAFMPYLPKDVVVKFIKGTDLISAYVIYTGNNYQMFVTNDMLDMYRITSDKLHETAIKNLNKGMFALSMPKNLTHRDVYKYHSIHHANAMLCKPFLKAYCEENQTNFITIVPLSVIQQGIIPYRKTPTKKEREALAKIMAKTNQSSAEDIKLSNSIYLYDIKTDAVTMLVEGTDELYKNGGPL